MDVAATVSLEFMADLFNLHQIICHVSMTTETTAS